MFEIYSYFNKNNLIHIERLSQNLTSFFTESSNNLSHPKLNKGTFFDFTNTYGNFKDNIYILNNCINNKVVMLPPITKLLEIYNKFCDEFIINFNCLENFKPPIHPNLILTELSEVLNKSENYKQKCLIQLSGNCYDYSMLSHRKTVLTNNQANLKALVNSSKINYDENSGNSYFTYIGDNSIPHFVWIEDTKSLSVKHNLIKDMGFKGIFWENPYILSEGNWESMYMAYQKR